MSAGVVDGSLVEAGERRSCRRIEASGMTVLIVRVVWGGEGGIRIERRGCRFICPPKRCQVHERRTRDCRIMI